MFFLAKCLFAILLVCFALDWRARGPSLASPHESAVDSRLPPRRPPGRAQPMDEAMEKGAELLRSGAKALQDQARAKCLARPRECLDLVRRAQDAAPAASRGLKSGGAGENP